MREAETMRGGRQTLQRVEWSSSGGLSPAGTELCSSHVAFAYPAEDAVGRALEGHFCSFFAIFRIFGVLLGLLKSTWLF